MKITDKYIFFWGGIFSQWYNSKVVIDGKRFNCLEQWMMYNKAVLFNDANHARLIMSSNNPKQQKTYGRRIKGFKKDKWEKVAYDIVKRGNYEKFTQNQDLKKELLETGNLTFVEASPYDKIWGIGMRENAPGIEDEKNWQGRNLLGKAITEVRDIIKNENENK